MIAWLKTKLKPFLIPKLGRLHHHPPKPFTVPRSYYKKKLLNQPLSLSIVTPSFNQGHFLEETIQSVLSQRYLALEYIIQDGGSNDQSVGILERYAASCHHIESTKDGGQSDALNRGFDHATGEIMAYLNSDDLLLPGSLHYIAQYFSSHPDVDVIYGHRILINEHSSEIGRWVLPPHDSDVIRWEDFIPQETLFWRRRVWDKIGNKIDDRLQFAMDWDLILRFHAVNARFVRLPRFLGAFRVHPQQKTNAKITIGKKEIDHLLYREHGKTTKPDEINRAIKKYLYRHLLYHFFTEVKIGVRNAVFERKNKNSKD